MTARRPGSGLARIARLEHRSERVVARRHFIARMGLAMAIWAGITALGLAIGMAGYAYFEGMGLIDSFVNAATIL